MSAMPPEDRGRRARLPGFDPETVPFDPDFADPQVRGAAVAASAMAPAALRARFASPPDWQPEITADGRLPGRGGPLRPAAVLVPLLVRSSGLSVLLTERSAHLTDHAGQISFPGGRVEQGDHDAAATALREADEELGLGAALVETLGALPLYLTATGFSVTPVVGLIDADPVLRPDPFEVAAVFEVPLPFLMDPANHQRRMLVDGAVRRTFYAMPYVAAGRRHFIWGATAAMLRNFYHLLRA